MDFEKIANNVTGSMAYDEIYLLNQGQANQVLAVKHQSPMGQVVTMSASGSPNIVIVPASHFELVLNTKHFEAESLTSLEQVLESKIMAISNLEDSQSVHEVATNMMQKTEYAKDSRVRAFNLAASIHQGVAIALRIQNMRYVAGIHAEAQTIVQFAQVVLDQKITTEEVRSVYYKPDGNIGNIF